MYGAILGDIVGSPCEFDCNNYKAKDFPLFSRRSDFTDDTVMTLAVAWRCSAPWAGRCRHQNCVGTGDAAAGALPISTGLWHPFWRLAL